MEQALRPHRGGTVLALGILSLLSAFLLMPLSVLAWLLGAKDLKGMREGRVDPSGRTLIQVGHVIGVVGTFAGLAWLGWGLLVAMPTVHQSESSGNTGIRITKIYYPRGLSGVGHDVVEWQYQELELSHGAVVKDGPAIHWSRGGKKLEEGSYRVGKRDGPWTFWNEDGSIDESRSGFYEDDVRVQAGPTPLGDWPVPPGSTDRR